MRENLCFPSSPLLFSPFPVRRSRFLPTPFVFSFPIKWVILSHNEYISTRFFHFPPEATRRRKHQQREERKRRGEHGTGKGMLRSMEISFGFAFFARYRSTRAAINVATVARRTGRESVRVRKIRFEFYWRKGQKSETGRDTKYRPFRFTTHT